MWVCLERRDTRCAFSVFHLLIVRGNLHLSQNPEIHARWFIKIRLKSLSVLKVEGSFSKYIFAVHAFILNSFEFWQKWRLCSLCFRLFQDKRWRDAISCFCFHLGLSNGFVRFLLQEAPCYPTCITLNQISPNCWLLEVARHPIRV